jgi:hypothetical protein
VRLCFLSGEKADGVHEVDVEKPVAVVVQEENAVSRRLHDVVLLRAAAPGDDVEPGRLRAILELHASGWTEESEKTDGRRESQIPGIIASRVKRPRGLRDLREFGKAG